MGSGINDCKNNLALRNCCLIFLNKPKSSPFKCEIPFLQYLMSLVPTDTKTWSTVYLRLLSSQQNSSIFNNTSEILLPPFALFKTHFLDFLNLAASSLARNESPSKRAAGVRTHLDESLIADDELTGAGIECVSSLQESDSGLHFLNDRLNLICSL